MSELMRKSVKLYYAGGLVPNGTNPILTSRQKTYILPLPGDWIEVPVYVAKDFSNRHKVVLANEDGTVSKVSPFTTSQKECQRLMKIISGEPVSETVETQSAYTEEQLLQMLETVKSNKGAEEPETEKKTRKINTKAKE